MKWPAGIHSGGTACGIKQGGVFDLGLIVVDGPAAWAGTFTRNAAAAAPVRWSRSLRGRDVRALVVNSGNANACTGEAGERAVQRSAEAVAGELGCSAEDVLVASTGPIGVPLPVTKLVDAVPKTMASLSDDVEGFAQAILTTDTRLKTASARAGRATMVGVAKGAAMCAPNMATMLAFIGTDAELDGGALQTSLGRAVETSFNRISIDGCESTNDSVFLFASATAGSIDDEIALRALDEVCSDLAHQIVTDAEGATRALRISVTGAGNGEEAAALARAVADSVLWRAAVHGADPNWGRIVAALGAVGRDLDLQDIDLSIGPELVFSKGEPVASSEAAAKAMDVDELDVACVVGSGRGRAQILSADISPAYVVLNAEGSS